MANVIKLRKGLDINLKGKAQDKELSVAFGDEYALVPDDFAGVTPKLAVHEGDCVKAGDALFVNKLCPDVRFASPVSGQVTAIVRGDRRKVLCVKVKADDSQQFVDFGKKDVNSLDAETVKKSLLEAGLFGYINQLPYAVSTTPDTMPKAIFVSALRDKPLAGDFEIELRGNESAFQAGLSALSKIAKVYLGIGTKQSASALVNAKDVEVNVFDGPCPAGNVGVQIDAGLPNISATFGSLSAPQGSPSFSGAVYNSKTLGTGISHNNAAHHRAVLYALEASRSSGIYGNSDTVQPNSQTVHICIKYK